MTILKPLFENPERNFHIRELSRILGINHTTIRKYLNDLTKDGILEKRKERSNVLYKSKLTRKYLNLKLYYNLEKIRISNIIPDLEKIYDYPTIILFGSYSKALDDGKSDLDLCVISNTNKEFNTEHYEKKTGRKISIHHFTKSGFEEAKIKNPELINSICNGIVLAGELEIL